MAVRRTRLVTALVGATALATVSQFIAVSGASAATGATTATSGSQSVIVLLRDQLASVPANKAHISQRKTRATSDQNTVLGSLSGAKPTKLKHFAAANAFSVTVTSAQAAQLAANPAVAAVLPDTKVSVPVQTTAPTSALPAATPNAKVAAPSAVPSSAICPTDPSKPLLEPEALSDTNTASDDPNAKTAQQLVDGTGVKVAYIADGIDPNNPDFIRKDGSHVITDYKAFSSDGPNPADGGAEAYGDASSIAAQGLVSHDLSEFVNAAYALPKGCNIRILGMSPGASIVALKIDFYASSIIQAIDYAVTVDHVDVINESFGGSPLPDSSARDAISAFNDQAVAAGVTVTVSSGDAGVTSTIGSPSTDPNVISVGATTNSRGYAQTGYAAFAFSNGKWLNDEVSSLSSAGFTQGGKTIDLSAPGEAGWAVCAKSGPECTDYNSKPSDVQLFGGTSQSAPLTAGAAALVIQAYRETHAGSSPSPALIKKLLTSTAKDLGLPAEEQGAGLLDSRAAVEAALTYPGATKVPPAGVSSNIALSTNQLNISAKPGSTTTSTVGVRNVGTKPLTVSAGTRNYATITDVATTTVINSTTDPKFPYAIGGVPWAYKKVSFSVPAGTDRLAAAMIWQGRPQKGAGGATVTPVVRLTLLDPTGTYVANSRPQGGPATANFANLDVAHPTAGVWTAIEYTVGGASGYTGDVTLRTTSQRAVPVGRVSPALFTLSPGQSKNVKVTLPTPAVSGDTADAITFASSGGHHTSIPAVIRAIVPITSSVGAFSGVITGGNARAGSAAQTFTYAFDVPKGKKDISVGVKLAHDAGDFLEVGLISPTGEVKSAGTNVVVDSSGIALGQGLGTQLNAINPIAGRWRIVVLVQNPVTGKDLEQSFTGKIAFNQSNLASIGLPNSVKTKIAAGSTVTAKLWVNNTGIAPIDVQADARTTALQTLELAPQFSSGTVKLPDGAAPGYLVPPGTQSLTVAASSTLPAQVELSSPTGGIDVVGDLKAAQAGNSLSVATVKETTDTVGQGYWFTHMEEVGAIGPDGAPTGTSTLVGSARTQGFDAAVTSSTGDPYLSAVDPTADFGTPVVINPGETGTITIKIKPTAKKGTKVTGVLYLVTPALGFATFNTTGDVIAAVPYSYTVS
ncbi:MAG: hypothetical protein JWN95_3240 [Frankiales bacterium]|nr:hypothetical protein [Frankiales bacterium]